MEQTEKRKRYIDITKGIGIFTVVLIHFAQRGSLLSLIISSFCVAQFFIISGYLFSVRKTFKDFVKNLIKKIIIPLLIYGCFDVIFTMFWKYVILNETFYIKDIIKMIAKIFFITGKANSNGPLWYLVTLFEIELIMYFLCKNDKYKVIIHIITIIIMLVLGYFIKLKGPFRIGQIPMSFIFFEIGYLSKALVEKLEKSSQKIKIGIMIVFFMIFAITCKINGFSELAALNYGNYYLLYFIVATSITVGLITLSMLLKECNILEYFGKNSLTIMCNHYYLAVFIIPQILKLLKIEYILSNEFIEIVFAIIVMVIMVPIISFINKKCPRLCGKTIKN